MPGSILMAGNFLSASAGTSRGVCEDLAERLAAGGWNIITTSGKLNKLSRLADMLRTVWRRRGEYRVAQVDVFSGPAFLWAELVCLTLRRLGKPYVLTLHGGELPVFARNWPGRMRRLLNSAALVTTPSRYLNEQMQAYRTDLRLLPNPIDLRRYPARVRERPQPKLAWLRAFHHIYNPALAPCAIAHLAGEFPNLTLTMFGPDKGDGSWQLAQQSAVDNGVAKHVLFFGKIAKTDVPHRLNESDIFLNTTSVDNTPVSVLEAMACGLAVVSTNVGGIPYLLADGHDALLVPPDNATAMAAAVRRILTEPGLAPRLSTNARHKVEQFDWSVILPQWEKIFQSLTVTSSR